MRLQHCNANKGVQFLLLNGKSLAGHETTAYQAEKESKLLTSLVPRPFNEQPGYKASC